jgi:hypothetical protein
MGKWKKNLKMYFNPKYLEGTMDWESGESVRGKLLYCCEDGMKMSRDNDPFYFVDEHYPQDNGFYES